jgi:hypothetical protein
MHNKETMKVSVSFKATHLKNAAGAFKGKSDPFVVITIHGNHRDSKPQIIGKIEVIKNTLDWVATFTVNHELGESTNIIVKIFDEVRKGDGIRMESAVFEKRMFPMRSSGRSR